MPYTNSWCSHIWITLYRSGHPKGYSEAARRWDKKIRGDGAPSLGGKAFKLEKMARVIIELCTFHNSNYRIMHLTQQ